MSDLILQEQIALFAINNPVPPEQVSAGQSEWIAFLIHHAEKFCELYANADWSTLDWYETSDAYIDPIIKNICRG
jgi:hypothetical protein